MPTNWTEEEKEQHDLWFDATAFSIGVPPNHKRMKAPWKNPSVHPKTRALYLELMEKHKPTRRRKGKIFELYRAGHLSLDETIDLMGGL